MPLRSFFIFLCLFYTSRLFAGDRSTLKFPAYHHRPDVISLELAGRSGYYSLSFDRIFFHQIAIGAGVSYLDDGRAHWMFPVYSQFYFLNPYGIHRLYTSLGYTLVTHRTGNHASYSVLPSDTAPISVGIGYEYRGWSGLLFRFTPYLLNTQTKIIATLGASLGWAF